MKIEQGLTEENKVRLSGDYMRVSLEEIEAAVPVAIEKYGKQSMNYKYIADCVHFLTGAGSAYTSVILDAVLRYYAANKQYASIHSHQSIVPGN